MSVSQMNVASGVAGLDEYDTEVFDLGDLQFMATAISGEFLVEWNRGGQCDCVNCETPEAVEALFLSLVM